MISVLIYSYYLYKSENFYLILDVSDQNISCQLWSTKGEYIIL